NGNVTDFQITNNRIHDDNNIGIDMIGGEADVFGLPAGTQNLPVARNGVCSHNTVYHIHANYGGGFAGGIYVDGGQNITLSDNVVTNNIFVAAANNVLLGSDGAGNVNNHLDYNLYFAPSAANAQFNWNSASYNGLASYRQHTGEDAHSHFAPPKFVNVTTHDF